MRRTKLPAIRSHFYHYFMNSSLISIQQFKTSLLPNFFLHGTIPENGETRPLRPYQWKFASQLRWSECIYTHRFDSGIGHIENIQRATNSADQTVYVLEIRDENNIYSKYLLVLNIYEKLPVIDYNINNYENLPMKYPPPY